MAGPLAPGSGCRRTTSNWELGELGSAQRSCVGTAGTQHGPPGARPHRQLARARTARLTPWGHQQLPDLLLLPFQRIILLAEFGSELGHLLSETRPLATSPAGPSRIRACLAEKPLPMPDRQAVAGLAAWDPPRDPPRGPSSITLHLQTQGFPLPARGSPGSLPGGSCSRSHSSTAPCVG